MDTGIKICTIGGGSSYTPELIEGFIKRYNELPVREIWLVDCEQGKEKLEIVGNLSKRMVKKSGLPIKINLTLDRRKALENADFVTTQMRVGLLDARIKDESISFKHGVMGQETNGPGGLFKGLRTIPVILDICKDMEDLCPNAWLINFTNPVGMVTEAVLRYSGIKKVIGLCNVPISMEKDASNLLEVDQNRVRVLFGGLNHMVYGLKVYLDGEEVTDTVLEKMGTKAKQHTMKNIDLINWDLDMLKALGVMPSPYHRYFYMYPELLEKALKKEETRGETVKKVEQELFELYKNPCLEEKPKVLEQRGGAYYSDAACNLICSIYNDKKDIQTVNIQNKGAITGIPYESAVEVSAVITKEGPVPLVIGELPHQINGLVQQIKSFERVSCEAAVTGERNKAILAMTIHPFVQSQDKAKAIFEDMIEEHKNYLPNFFD
ncbi:6-phospho-beta-glucosidase [Clostridioides difficile]